MRKLENHVSMALAALLLCIAGGSGRSDEQAGAAAAPFSTAATMLEGREWALVKTGKVVLFGIPVDAGGLTRQERARKIAYSRLTPLSRKPGLSIASRYRVREVNGEVTISFDNQGNAPDLPESVVILTVDHNFEKALKHNRMDIACYWRDLLVANMKRGHRRGLRDHSAPDIVGVAPDGKEIDPENSWRSIPDGYSKKAK